MMTQVDELNSEKFMRMTYIEWLEAIARAADIISLSPYEWEVFDWWRLREKEET